MDAQGKSISEKGNSLCEGRKAEVCLPCSFDSKIRLGQGCGEEVTEYLSGDGELWISL